jgi:hypothetical protein
MKGRGPDALTKKVNKNNSKGDLNQSKDRHCSVPCKVAYTTSHLS